MPWIETSTDINGFFHIYPPSAKVRKIKVSGKGDLQGTIRVKGVKTTVKWIDKEDSLLTAKSKFTIVSAKMLKEASLNVYLANSKLFNMKVASVQIPTEIDKAYNAAHAELAKYGEAMMAKKRMDEEFEAAAS